MANFKLRHCGEEILTFPCQKRVDPAKHSGCVIKSEQMEFFLPNIDRIYFTAEGVMTLDYHHSESTPYYVPVPAKISIDGCLCEIYGGILSMKDALSKENCLVIDIKQIIERPTQYVSEECFPAARFTSMGSFTGNYYTKNDVYYAPLNSRYDPVFIIPAEVFNQLELTPYNEIRDCLAELYQIRYGNDTERGFELGTFVMMRFDDGAIAPMFIEDFHRELREICVADALGGVGFCTASMAAPFDRLVTHCLGFADCNLHFVNDDGKIYRIYTTFPGGNRSLKPERKTVDTGKMLDADELTHLHFEIKNLNTKIAKFVKPEKGHHVMVAEYTKQLNEKTRLHNEIRDVVKRLIDLDAYEKEDDFIVDVSTAKDGNIAMVHIKKTNEPRSLLYYMDVDYDDNSFLDENSEKTLYEHKEEEKVPAYFINYAGVDVESKSVFNYGLVISKNEMNGLVRNANGDIVDEQE